MARDKHLGSVFGKTYRLDELIGEGGMGSVYRASHLRLPKTFAIKVLTPAVLDEPGVFERFKREAEIACSIADEHIVEVFDFNVSDDGAPYMVMELLDGEDLSQRIDRVGALKVSEVAAILEQTTEALEATHARGIIHRDLKPPNLFLCSHPSGHIKVKILDFGISKVLDMPNSGTQTGMVIGTPNYMAPEQAREGMGAVDHRADVFALGVIVYECLTGQVPFDGPTNFEILTAVCNDEPTPMREINPSLPEQLEEVVRKAMAKDRDDRFGGAAEFCMAFNWACENTWEGKVLEGSRPGTAKVGLYSDDEPTSLYADSVQQPVSRAESQPPSIREDAAITQTQKYRDSSPIRHAVPDTEAMMASAIETPSRGTRRRRSRALAAIVGMAALVVLAVIAITGGADEPSKTAATAPVSTSQTPPAANPATPTVRVEPTTDAKLPAKTTAAKPSPVPTKPKRVTIDVVLKVTPKWATVLIDDTMVLARKLRLKPDKVEHTIVVKAKGFVKQTRKVTLEVSKTIKFNLKKRAKPPKNDPRKGPKGPWVDKLK